MYWWIQNCLLATSLDNDSGTVMIVIISKNWEKMFKSISKEDI